jgi:ABC-2 type transport system ATP-binding protein
MSALSVENLSKVYRSGLRGKQQTQALTDFSLDVEPGQIFGLLGPNGAGKTTFVRIILSLVRPTSGTVSLLGIRLPDTAVRSRVGYLPEQHRYPSHLNGEQALQLFGKLTGTPPSVLRERVPALLKLVGLSDWKKAKVKRYSKGMVQRLGLAHALVNDPEILFLDEPTDGLDPVGRKEIRDVLVDLKRQGKTVFLNSHLLSEVELVCDSVAILNRGRLLRVASVDELTLAGSTFEIGFAGEIPPAFQEEAEALVLKLTFGNQVCQAELESTAALNRLIDLLRKHGVEITSVAQRKSSLEDSFLNLLKPEGRQ